jgi:hypothetical protein
VNVDVGRVLDQAVDERDAEQLLPTRAQGLPYQDLRHVLLVSEREHSFQGVLGFENLELAGEVLHQPLDAANPVRVRTLRGAFIPIRGMTSRFSLGPFGLPRIRGRAQETSRHPGRVSPTGQLLTGPTPLADHPTM